MPKPAARRIIEDHRARVTAAGAARLEDLEPLQLAIDYRFRDPGLLEHALTHTSRANEDVSGGVADNESLEFLGDAVLGFVVADTLFRRFPRYSEGQKSKVKASLVSTATLARLAGSAAAAAGVHGGDQLQAGRIGDAVVGAGDDQLAGLQRLAQGVEHGRLELG